MTELELLKYDLQILTASYDGYLGQLLTAARALITREGITLMESAEDTQLVVMYAAYLYRRRSGEDTGMPRMLRWALNNRLMSEKAGEDDVS